MDTTPRPKKDVATTPRPKKDVDPVLWERCLQLTREGKTLRAVSVSLGVDTATVLRWRHLSEDRARQYARSRLEGYEALADSLLDVPEEVNDIHRARLLSDNVKWLLSKRLPSQYGERLDVNVTAQVDIAGALAAARARALQPMCNLITVDAGVLAIDAAPKPPDTQSSAQLTAAERYLLS